MAFNLDFDITVDNGKKTLLLIDKSNGFTTTEGNKHRVKSVTISTICGTWRNKLVEYPVDLAECTFDNDDEELILTQNMTLQIPSSAISNDGSTWDFIYDDLYTIEMVTEEIDSEYAAVGDEVSRINSEILMPLSKYFVSNYTLSYNYFSPSVQTEEMIMRYNTWLAMLPTLAEESDNNRISEILSIFKKIVTAYGLPE
jgi:hypothetical protein